MGGAVSASTVLARIDMPSAEIGDELVVLDEPENRYLGLDATGRRVWELLDGVRTVSDICTELAQEYDVAPERCADDVVRFLAQLQDAGLARPVR